jgi:hypothetical protein
MPFTISSNVKMLPHVLRVVSKHQLNSESLNGDFWNLTSEVDILRKLFLATAMESWHSSNATDI